MLFLSTIVFFHNYWMDTVWMHGYIGKQLKPHLKNFVIFWLA
jgi:hypothetical protein